MTARARGGLLVRLGTLLAMVAGLVVGTAAGAEAAGGLDVYVGYMDTHTSATTSKQPSPWPYTDSSRFVGSPCPDYGKTSACWDASAVMLTNGGTSDVTGLHVTVKIGGHTFDLWGSNLTVKAESYLVLTETGAQNSQNFDGSDASPNDYNAGGPASCVNSGAIPVVTVAIGGSATSYDDTGQVLNGGGVDSGHCVDGQYVSQRQDESHPWELIGTAPAGGGGGGGTTATAPSAPTGVQAVAGDTSVALTWSAPADNGGPPVTGYQVLRGTTAGAESALEAVTSPSYNDTGLINGTKYYYKVVAVNAVGSSPPSGEVSATPQASPQPPGGGPGPAPGPQPSAGAPSVPTGVSATAADGEVRLSWSAPSSDGGSPVTGYRVYRGTAAGGETALTEVSGTGFADHAVRNGTTYFYAVAALNDVGASGRSQEVSATPESSPAPGPSPSPSPRVCAGLRGCHVTARADVNGDGHRDVIAMARRGGRSGARGALILRVKVGPERIVATRRRLDNWTGSPWLGVSRLDGHRGKDIVVGRLMGAAAGFYQAITWRRGHLVLLDAPGRGLWWSVEQSATLLAGWQRRAADPVGTIRRRIATHGPEAGPYQGTIKTYQWTRSGWRLVQTGRVASLPLRRALRWGGFDVPGLRRG